jgi:hypothetical protein
MYLVLMVSGSLYAGQAWLSGSLYRWPTTKSEHSVEIEFDIKTSADWTLRA